MQDIWVASWSHYVHGVFDSEEKAVTYAKWRNTQTGSDMIVTKYTLNEDFDPFTVS